MRGLYIFAAGALAGLILQMAVAQSRNTGIVGVNHVGISVADLDEAVDYYSETLGFPEAFRVVGDNDQVALVYMQVSRDTFVELQPSNPQRPPGFTHFGIQVEDIEAVSEMFEARGVAVPDARVSSTRAVLSNVVDPDGNRMELLELPPDSLHGQAIARWE
jgi:lactoylglutathione lyase